MSLIDVSNLTFSYDGGYKDIFSNVSFKLDTDWRLGLVGRNGRGKTTLLKLLMGEYEYRGRISTNVKFTYFPYEIKDKSRLTCEVLSEICPCAEEWKIARELRLLKLDIDALYRPYDTLSSGEQIKAAIAGLFLNEGDYLLIDEPTNHLDAEARDAVAKYLRSKKGYIIVSHDRAFLDACVDHIISINKSDIEVRSGNFSVYLDNFNLRQSFEIARDEKLKKDIARLSEAARRTADWADKTEASKYGKASSGLRQDKGYVGHKAAKMMQRSKAALSRKQRAIEEKSELMHNVEDNPTLAIYSAGSGCERLLTITDLGVRYGDKTVCSHFNLEISRGERIAISGRNGCGKSSVLKLIAGEDIEHTGLIRGMPNLKVSYVPQTTKGLSGSLSEIALSYGVDESLFKAMLSKMNFNKADFDSNAEQLSEGQKKKLLVARSLCERAHLYVWDEPLNYIDVFTRMQIEDMLKEADITLIFVEHDKAFRQSIATRIIDM
ncbi:MAG: ABC-F type ribosomal protection protein [Clostridia bacterium]|nr:ABC-F type ribosomal protection protein [Clostridia bacterium]